MKILSESVRPWKYFTGPSVSASREVHSNGSVAHLFVLQRAWNCFDFLIIMLTVLPLGNNYTALRMVRLLRLTKMIKHAPRLKVLLAGLWGGLSQIMYISLLIMLLQYLYAIIGIVLFGDNDPEHFRSLFRAMITLLRVATLEDWTDVFYINYYGCDTYSNDQRYVVGDTFNETHFLLPNNQTALMLRDKVLCNMPLAQPGMATIYFFSFTMVCFFAVFLPVNLISVLFCVDCVFVELFVNVAAHGFRPTHFWFDHGRCEAPMYWNWFDTVIVVASARRVGYRIPQDLASSDSSSWIMISTRAKPTWTSFSVFVSIYIY